MLKSTTRIEIDIDVHREIEARRTGFDQTQNEILRDVFGLNDSGASLAVSIAQPARTRQTGPFRVELFGSVVEAHSLKDAYMRSLRLLSDREPRFLELLSLRHTRARRIVARRKEDLYLSKPELAGKFAARLCDGWWVDTNLSRQQCESRLATACEVAGLSFGSDLRLHFGQLEAHK